MKIAGRWMLVLSMAVLVFMPFKAEGQFIFDENPLLHKQAPDFTLALTSDETTSLNKYRGSDPAIVFFWTTWCPACREEMRLLVRQADGFKKKGIKVILVDAGESPRRVKSFLDKIKLPFPSFIDEESLVSEQYGLIGLPTLFFIDRDGVVVDIEHALPDNFADIFAVEVSK